jgi:DNA modification methylase
MEKGDPYKRKWTENKVNNLGYGIKGVETENNGTRYPISILDFPQKWRRQDQIHSFQKPVELLEYLIKSYSKEGDLILDFTAGSFSSAIAAYNTKRSFIGIEKDKFIFDKAIERLKNLNINF